MSNNTNTYLSLTFILIIIFESVHAEMIKCFVGGIFNYEATSDEVHSNSKTQMLEEHCNEMVKESVLQKYYIDQFGMSILGDSKDVRDIDYPIMTSNINIVEHYFEKKKKVYQKHFMKLLNTNKSIVDYWDYIMEVGTDMHILKFYNKLINMFDNNYEFTKEESIIFLKSNFCAVGIYYFTNNIIVARGVAKDGIYIFKLMKKYINYKDTDEIEVLMWDILTSSVYIEIHESDSTVAYTKEHFKNLLNIALSKFDSLISNGEEYPCSYLFMYRDMLLNKYQQLISGGETWNKLVTLINDGKIKICENYLDKRKLQRYMDIILSVYDPETEKIKGLASFNHLINAIQIPVLTSEDRLLNYKVTSLIMKKIESCVSGIGWKIKTGNSFCNTLDINRRKDQNLGIILKKLTYMQIYQMTTDDFVPDIFDANTRIVECKVHMIVTMAINNIDINSDTELKRIKIVNATITELNHYIKEQTNPNRIDYRNIMIAYKWLAELHGVLCTDRKKKKEIKLHQKSLEKSLKEAIELQKKYKIQDKHLEFLFYKKICKDLHPSRSWERQYVADGWIQNKPNLYNRTFSNSIFLNNDCGEISKFLNIDSPFIHQADLNILIFKHFLMKSPVLNYIQSAISHMVISSEDRVRNIQANDLYNMYFIWENYYSINN